MSQHGKGIIERLHPLTVLRNPTNDGHKVIDNTIGEYLDRFEKKDLGKQLFLLHATGKYLDLHGLEKGISRKKNESDDVYRNRIIVERGMHNCISDFRLRGVDFWCYVDGLGAGSNEFFIQVVNEEGLFFKNVDVNLSVENVVDGSVVDYVSKTNMQGLAYFKIPNINQLSNISYNIAVDNTYNDAIGNLTLNSVSSFKQNTIIMCNDTDIIRHTDFIVQLITTNGTSIPNKDVIITVNGISYTCKTDLEGNAKLTINLYEGDYDITYEFKGDDEYNSCNGSTTIHDFSGAGERKNIYVNMGMINDIHSSELTSKNTYLDNKYLAHASVANQMNLESKFLNNKVITWF